MKLYTIAETAELLGLSPKTLYDVRQRRRLGLPVVQLGTAIRILDADIEKLIRARRIDPQKSEVQE
jgi:excisionase family DNA binding protein